MTKLIIFTSLILGFSASGGAAEKPPIHAAAKPGRVVTYSSADKACTDSETWEFGSAIPAAWAKHLKASANSQDSAVELFAWANQLKMSTKNPEAVALADFFMGKSFYALKLVHLAHDSFDSALNSAQANSTNGVKFAALDCLAQIRKEYPSIVVGKDASAQLSKLGETGKTKVLEEALAYMLRKKMSETSEPVEAALSDILAKNPTFSDYATIIEASHAGEDAKVIRMGEKFLASNPVDSLKNHFDLVNLLVGQAYYNLKSFKKSAAHFRAVPSTSNYLAQALTEMSWAQLQAKQYPESLASSRNLMGGILARTFAPDANIVSAITFSETCHYAESLKSLALLKSQYASSYRWLYNWNRGLPASSNLYPKVAEYLQKKSGVPDKIATEWLRSPLFQANQEEMNLLIDEKQAFPEILRATAKFAQANPRKANYIKPMDQMIQTAEAQAIPRETNLVAQINRDLSMRTRQMLLTLVDNMENSQLVEADVYNFIGDKILADNIPSSYRTDDGKMKKPENHPGNSGWDWGRAPANDDSHAEVWDDELGYLQATLSNDCNRR